MAIAHTLQLYTIYIYTCACRLFKAFKISPVSASPRHPDFSVNFRSQVPDLQTGIRPLVAWAGLGLQCCRLLTYVFLCEFYHTNSIQMRCHQVSLSFSFVSVVVGLWEQNFFWIVCQAESSCYFRLFTFYCADVSC